eukprot:TRINITY_DN91608_c0_g1_i1.p1 TRINITY_DN91608_c0_g1~~TRINITY_DN91608_c0_g1_i1.p1  ORF type:complete len:278 (+),score=69.56 TRINITY_DN91608_c0_g1_i1:97-930(+)
MSWLNNNKRNARFDPNRRDDRLLTAEVTARRVHKAPRAAEPEDEETVTTDLDHVLSMSDDSRVDWLQLALMQVALSKLKAAAVFDVMKHAKFSPRDQKFRKQARAMFLANLHIFTGVQRKVLEKAVAAWSSNDDSTAAGAGVATEKDRRSKRRNSSSSGSSSNHRSRKRQKKSARKEDDEESPLPQLEEELLSTDLGHVLSMSEDARVDWLQIACLQVAPGKLAANDVYDVVKHPDYCICDSKEAQQKMRSLILANLHHFSEKQKKHLEKVVSGWKT